MSNGLRRTRLNGWFEFAKEMCPICGHMGGCMINEKGDTVVCIRQSSDIEFSKTFQSWVHRLGEKKSIHITKSNVKEREKAESWTLDSFFRLLNENLTITNEHIQHLKLERKMSDTQIAARQYKSFPKNTWETASAVVNRIPNFDKLNLGIPGFYKKGESWNLQGGQGLLIPYRNEENEIIGYQIRVDEPKNFLTVRSEKKSIRAMLYKQPNLVRIINEDGELINERTFKVKEELKVCNHKDTKDISYVKLNAGQRYYWLSSANKEQGCGAGGPTPYHIAVTAKKLIELEQARLLGNSTAIEAKSVWLTEGALKADIAIEQLSMALGDKLTDIGEVMLAVPGVNSWKVLLPIIKKMKIERINLAFDIDAMENEQVAQQLKDCIVELKKMGINVYIAIWNPSDGKGLDDLLINLKIPVLKKI